MSSVYGVTDSNPTVTTTVIAEGPGDSSVKVAVSYQFSTIIKYPGLPQSLTLNRTVHMRVLPIEIADDVDDDEDP